MLRIIKQTVCSCFVIILISSCTDSERTRSLDQLENPDPPAEHGASGNDDSADGGDGTDGDSDGSDGSNGSGSGSGSDDGSSGADGGSTSDPIGDADVDLTNEPWTNTPETDYITQVGEFSPGTTQVFHSPQDSMVFLRFQGDEEITYMIDYSPGSQVARGRIEVNELTSQSQPISNMQVYYRTSGGGSSPLPNSSIQGSPIIDQNSVTFYYNDLGDLKRLHTFEIRGKVLRIHTQAREETINELRYYNNYGGIEVGPTDQTNNPKLIQMQGNLSNPTFSFVNNGELYFTSVQLDFTQSHASDWDLHPAPEDVSPGSDSIDFNYHTHDSNFSGGYKRLYNPGGPAIIAANLRESVSVAVSRKIKDVFVRSTKLPSAYRDMTERRTSIIHSKPGSMTTVDWSKFKVNLEEFVEFGMNAVNVYHHAWWTTSAYEGNQNVGPDWWPIVGPACGGSQLCFKDYSLFAKNRGMTMGLYFYLGAAPTGNIGPGGSPYFDLCSPSSNDPECIWNQMVLDSNGNAKFSNFGSSGNWELIHDSAINLYYIDDLMQEAKDHHLDNVYTDVVTYATTSNKDRVDQNANSAGSKTLRHTTIDRKHWIQKQQRIIGGHVYGEASIATYRTNMEYIWMGYADSTQRVINTGSNVKASNFTSSTPQHLSPAHWYVIPNLEYEVYRDSQANHGLGHYDRFFSLYDGEAYNPETGGPLYPIPEVAFDLLSIYFLTYGHSAHNNANPIPLYGNYLTKRTRIEMYYMHLELQRRYMNSDVVSIEYDTGSGLKTFEETLKDNYGNYGVFFNPRIRIELENGTVMYLNHRNTQTWDISYQGKTYRLPHDTGYLVYQKGTNFIAFTAQVDDGEGSGFTPRIDYVNALPNYEMFDGRGNHSGYGNVNTFLSGFGNQNGLVIHNHLINRKILEAPDIDDLHVSLVPGGCKDYADVLNQEPYDSNDDFCVTPLVPDSQAPTIVSTEVIPETLKMRRDQEYGLQAWVTLSNGARRDVTELIEFTSSNTDVAWISGPGVFSGNPGTAQLSVSDFQGMSFPEITVEIE